VFRAAVLSIVFAFAVAPDETLICSLWCPNDGSASSCYHHEQSSSARVRATDFCDAANPGVVALTREDTRRVAAGSGTGRAVPVERYQIVRPSRHPRTVDTWARAHALERRPLETILRL
jgi:hypothetical protein